MSIAIRPTKKRLLSPSFPTVRVVAPISAPSPEPRRRIFSAEAPDRGDTKREAPDAGETRRGGSGSEGDFTHGRSWS